MEDTGLTVAAVIMAGGKGTRFYSSGAFQPKCLLRVGCKETLITRVINQLGTAGITEAVVCCSPENHQNIDAFLNADSANCTVPTNVQTLSCLSTRLGPLPALSEVVSGISAEWCLLCMADIFFAQAPYNTLLPVLASDLKFDGHLVTGVDEMPVNDRGSGAVLCNGNEVEAISYHPFSPETPLSANIRQWSGSFLFRTRLISDLVEHLDEYHHAPYEAWLQGLINRGARCGWIEGGRFLNINSMREYEFLVQRTSE